MKTSSAVGAAVAVTALYVIILIWVDSRNQVFSQLPLVAATLPALMALSLLSYAVRYLRWQWLLRRAHGPVPWLRGFLAYLAGFAFTATPGKVGELVRIRYFQPLGVPASRVLAAFVFERAFDLMVIVLLSGLAIHDVRLFWLLLAFVITLLAVVYLVALYPRRLGRIAAILRYKNHSRMARVARTLKTGLAGCRTWLTPTDMAISLVLGLIAWGLTAMAFVLLLHRLGIALPLPTAAAIYPTAMLAGAASMLPAGIGTTEVTIVALLALHQIPVGVATLVAVGIRAASLWFAVLCGFTALGVLERYQRQARRR